MAQVRFHFGDLPADYKPAKFVAIDTETLGLNPHRDKLCVIQLSNGDGTADVVQLDRSSYDCPVLKKMLADTSITKIFHFARFDVAVISKYLGIDVSPIYCTKIASKLVRTYTDRHGLKELCRELIGKDLSKQQQSSDWGADKLSDAQLNYAADDVLYLHALMEKLNTMLAREGRTELALSCFNFLPIRAQLDLAGWEETDIFAHS